MENAQWRTSFSGDYAMQTPFLMMRWVEPDDLPRLVGIDSHSPNIWSYRDFEKVQKSPHALSAVIEREGFIAGYIVFVVGAPEVHRDGSVRLDSALAKMAVDPEFRRQKLGGTMIQAVERFALNRASSQGQRGTVNLTCMIRETNLVAQLFFKSLGFRATRVAQRSFGDVDGYVMMRSCSWNAGAAALPPPAEA